VRKVGHAHLDLPSPQLPFPLNPGKQIPVFAALGVTFLGGTNEKYRLQSTPVPASSSFTDTGASCRQRRGDGDFRFHWSLHVEVVPGAGRAATRVSPCVCLAFMVEARAVSPPRNRFELTTRPFNSLLGKKIRGLIKEEEDEKFGSDHHHRAVCCNRPLSF
jgi:hypothetical protein